MRGELLMISWCFWVGLIPIDIERLLQLVLVVLSMLQHFLVDCLKTTRNKLIQVIVDCC